MQTSIFVPFCAIVEVSVTLHPMINRLWEIRSLDSQSIQHSPNIPLNYGLPKVGFCGLFGREAITSSDMTDYSQERPVRLEFTPPPTVPPLRIFDDITNFHPYRRPAVFRTIHDDRAVWRIVANFGTITITAGLRLTMNQPFATIAFPYPSISREIPDKSAFPHQQPVIQTFSENPELVF
jgi:hypothetical protein